MLIAVSGPAGAAASRSLTAGAPNTTAASTHAARAAAAAGGSPDAAAAGVNGGGGAPPRGSAGGADAWPALSAAQSSSPKEGSLDVPARAPPARVWGAS